jgi:transcriptional regulator with XRE-family HTH domain
MMAKSLHTPEYEYFRSLMVAARERSGLTQTDVSARLGRPQSFVSKYESGERRLDVVEFVQVCIALGVEPQAIVADVEAWIRERSRHRAKNS